MRPWMVAVLVIVGVIGLGFVHPFGDPRVEPAKGLGALLQDSHMSPDAKAVLVTKCADCHSNETRWPVYARIAPGSWLIERDIIEARKHMNLSRWREVPVETQQLWSTQIIQEARSDDMPPLQYLALHWGAKLSSADVQSLSTLGKGDRSEAALAGDGDTAHGKAVFEKRCTGCHAIQADREGPRLAGVFGRKAGSIAGFAYSAGLKKSGVIWDEAALEKWLRDPDLMVHDNNMGFSTPKAKDRRDLIAFLMQQPAAK